MIICSNQRGIRFSPSDFILLSLTVYMVQRYLNSLDI
jgi:hypothetical protein